MKKLYDEILQIRNESHPHESISWTNGYRTGHQEARHAAAELAKKYDDEIEKLNDVISKLQSTSKMLLELSRTRYNEGLSAGKKSIRKTLDEVAVIKESYLNENEKLSTLLLNAEDEIDRLKGAILNLECRIEFLEK